jgi:hypothetical protein
MTPDAPRTEPNTEAASYIEDDPEAWSGWVDTVRRYAHHFGPLIAELGSEEAAASVLGGTILAYLADQHGLYLRREAATPDGSSFRGNDPADSLDALRAQFTEPGGLDYQLGVALGSTDHPLLLRLRAALRTLGGSDDAR